jgi:hypothetical protein
MEWASGGFDTQNPLTLTLDSLNVNSGLLHFANWFGDPDTGFGSTRILVNVNTAGSNLSPGLLINGVQFAEITETSQALVKRANDGLYVLIPFDNAFIWDGTSANNNWVGANWTRSSTFVHGTDFPKGTQNSPAIAIFDTDMTQDGLLTPALATSDFVTLTEKVYLMGLVFRGDTEKDYVIQGAGDFDFSSGAAVDGSSTTISNTGAGNVTINIPVNVFFSEPDWASYSSTIEIQQQGTGNITFMQGIGGPSVGITVTSSAGSGYVAFNADNAFSEGLTLNSGRVFVGTNAALSTGSNAIVRLRGGSLRATNGLNEGAGLADAARVLSNAYVFDGLHADSDPASSTVRIEGTGNFSLLGNGVVASDTTVDVENTATTLTLGSAASRLDAVQTGAELTLTGGKVEIAANEVGKVGASRGSGPIGAHTTG